MNVKFAYLSRFLLLVFVFLWPCVLMAQLSVGVKSISSEQVSLYEKFEVNLTISNAQYTNPFDPDKIDVRAFFQSPSDSVWQIFGFYDNYQTRNAWKVRFAPNEIGSWQFYVQVINKGDTATSNVHTFQCLVSDYHGWIRISEQNPHYFQYDDGTPFYGIAAYYPWGVSNGAQGLELLQKSGANLFGYWNIPYGDEKGIIESLNSGIGHYDQTKCGRIDQVLQWAEEHNLKIMFAIWPHDLLSKTVWAHLWDENPYKYVCKVDDFYSDTQAWNYQKKQYRYLIARWGYSRALAIWEIVNEINGTDGWQHGHRLQATNWVKKVHDFFQKNDPHRRPSTASQSGGIYWPQGYSLTDVPNVHLYETSWSPAFPGNPLRSSAFLYHQMAGDLFHDFQKPGILGEAGYLNTFGNFDVPSAQYTQLYHNAIWAAWAGGNATTPFWWSFNQKIMSNDVLQQMLAFSKVAKSIQYLHYEFKPLSAEASHLDVFGLESPTLTFGWAREMNGNSAAQEFFTLNRFTDQDTAFSIQWINTWSGNEIFTEILPSNDGDLTLQIPDDGSTRPDVAFLIYPVVYGGKPFRLQLISTVRSMFCGDTVPVPVLCYVKDSLNRVANSQIAVNFGLKGPGILCSSNPVTTSHGMAKIFFRSNGHAGRAVLVAKAGSLLPDSVCIELKSQITIDDFEYYSDDMALQSVWLTRGGTSATITLDRSDFGDGNKSLRMDYAIGNGNPYYAGIFKLISKMYPGANVLRFWLKDDVSNRDLIIVLKDSSGKSWQYTLDLNHANGMWLNIPLHRFTTSDPPQELQSSQIREISFNVMEGNAGSGQGYLNLDGITLQNETFIDNQSPNELPKKIRLEQNYPNPFNGQTVVKYFLPQRSNVSLQIFDIVGRKVRVLKNGYISGGWHAQTISSQSFASGVYFVVLQAGQIKKVIKLMTIK